MIISIDFDGCLFHEVYPGVGDLIDGAAETVNWLHGLGHKIIINSCREGVHMEVAIAALNKHGIKWDLFNSNDPERIEHYGIDSRKIGCDISIDDRDINVKATTGIVDWVKTRNLFEKLLLPKKKIICIVGSSGTGKTYLAEYLRKQYGIPMIESYTDRPMRYENEVGHTFLSKEEFDDLNMADMIAFTCWKQDNGDIARYCCLRDDIQSEVSTYVIDERGLKYLRKYWSSEFSIFSVRVFANDKDIRQRVDKERIKRDAGNFNMSSDEFDYFIYNDYGNSMYKKYDALYDRIKKL